MTEYLRRIKLKAPPAAVPIEKLRELVQQIDSVIPPQGNVRVSDVVALAQIARAMIDAAEAAPVPPPTDEEIEACAEAIRNERPASFHGAVRACLSQFFAGRGWK